MHLPGSRVYLAVTAPKPSKATIRRTPVNRAGAPVANPATLALLAAALTDRELRGHLLNAKASISAVIALAIVTPYLLSMLDGGDSVAALGRV